MNFALVCILSYLPILVLGNVGIPVMIFKDERVESTIPKPLSGHTIASKDFGDLLKLYNKPELAVVFVQDELSNEDFLRLDKDMKSGGLFKNIQKYADLEASLYFPSVKAPVHSLKTLTGHYDDQIKFTNAEKAASYLTDSKLKAGTSVVINLLPTNDEETSSQAIKRNDEIVGDVMKLVEKTGFTYIAVFTGKSFRKAHGASVVQGVGRHLLQSYGSDERVNGSYFYHQENATGCMIYMESVEVQGTVWDSSNTKIECGNATTNDSSINGIEITLTGENGTEVLLTFVKDVSIGWWYLSEVMIDKQIQDKTLLRRLAIEAPLASSYHCGVKTDINYNKTKISMTIQRLQVQVFDFDTVAKFGDPYDCVGFFTIPLWTGLLISLFLIVVTVYGMTMLASVQTFDQYDDPKSKPLTINVSE